MIDKLTQETEAAVAEQERLREEMTQQRDGDARRQSDLIGEIHDQPIYQLAGSIHQHVTPSLSEVL